jgi:hypothetical protein
MPDNGARQRSAAWWAAPARHLDTGRAECCRGNGSPGLIAQRAEPVVCGALRGKGGEPARSRACALCVVSRRASALAMPGGVASNMPTSRSSRAVWAEPFGRAGIEAAEVEAARASAGGHGAQPLGPGRSPRRQGRHRFLRRAGIEENYAMPVVN